MKDNRSSADSPSVRTALFREELRLRKMGRSMKRISVSLFRPDKRWIGGLPNAMVMVELVVETRLSDDSSTTMPWQEWVHQLLRVLEYKV